MEIVRSKTGAASAEDFRNSTGSPLVIDQTVTTGRVYFVDSAGNIREVGGVLTSLSVGTLSVTTKLTITAADGGVPFLLSGTTKGLRAHTSSSGAILEAVDSTGAGSYQPLYIGGSTLNWLISGVAKGGVDASGNLTCTALLDISGASAGQIKFPATANPSSDVNTLDDYEEGTWTPVDSSGASLTFTSASGSYTKIGRLVYVNAVVVYPVTASGANALIGGLPFTLSALNAVGSCYTTGGTVLASLGAATTTLVVPVAAATGVARTNAQMSGSTLAFSMSYEV